MSYDKGQRKPGDVIIDHYMPNASVSEREEARENLYAFVAVLLRIATRRVREDAQQIRPNDGKRVKSTDGSAPSP